MSPNAIAERGPLVDQPRGEDRAVYAFSGARSVGWGGLRLNRCADGGRGVESCRVLF